MEAGVTSKTLQGSNTQTCYKLAVAVLVRQDSEDKSREHEVIMENYERGPPAVVGAAKLTVLSNIFPTLERPLL